jgi:hypothetical protein
MILEKLSASGRQPSRHRADDDINPRPEWHRPGPSAAARGERILSLTIFYDLLTIGPVRLHERMTGCGPKPFHRPPS